MKNKNKKGKKEINMSFTVLKNCGFHNLDVNLKNTWNQETCSYKFQYISNHQHIMLSNFTAWMESQLR